MMSNNIKEEFHNICYHASIGMCSFDDVENWLINNKSSDDILSSEEAIKILIQHKAPLYHIRKLLNIIPEPAKIIGDCDQYLLHMACTFGASVEVVQILYEINPNIISTSDDDGNLPLHLACKTNSSSQVIEFLIEKYKVALQIQNSHYHTPLHLACSNKDSSVDTIRKLVTMYPKATKSGDINGELPIHLECCKEEIVLENLKALLNANPNSIWAENIYGITPSYNCNSNDENKYHHLIKDCILQGYSVSVIKLLSKNFMSTAGSWCDEDGNSLLHHECMKTGMTISPDIINFLVTLSPNNCYSKNKDGNSPCELLSKVAIYEDEHGMLLLHRIAKTFNVNFKAIEFIVDAHPSSIFTTDHYGMLPFHYGLLNTWVWDCNVVYTLLRLYPNAVGSIEDK
jgi:ankyrin repeat protein